MSNNERLFGQPVKIRLTSHLRQCLEQQAAADGRTLSQLVRQVMAEWLNIKYTEPRTGRNPDFRLLQPILGTLGRISGRVNQIAKAVNRNSPIYDDIQATLRSIQQTDDAILAYLSGRPIDTDFDTKPDQYTPDVTLSDVPDDPALLAALEEMRGKISSSEAAQ